MSSSIGSNDDERFLVRVAWACEIEGLTQAEAADRFGVTRLRVIRAFLTLGYTNTLITDQATAQALLK